MSRDEKYRQLAVFSVIVAEVVVTPLVLGGLMGLIFRNHPGKSGFSVLGALVGLALAFYRISKISKRAGEKDGK
jgi:hypothetical protein